MTKDRYAIYGLAIVAGGAVAIWVGVSPAFLLFLLACPVMMFFMMRGMHDGQSSGDKETRSPSSDTQQQPAPSQPRTLDGSHERIDQR